MGSSLNRGPLQRPFTRVPHYVGDRNLENHPTGSILGLAQWGFGFRGFRV